MSEPREFRAGDECDRCDSPIAAACLPCEFGGCRQCMDWHDERCPENPDAHVHGHSPWSAECAACQRMNAVHNRECAEQRERELQAEIERLQDAWLQDEGIAPDGTLRATVSRTVKRAADAEALLFKIHKLSDPNAASTSGASAAESGPQSPSPEVSK